MFNKTVGRTRQGNRSEEYNARYDIPRNIIPPRVLKDIVHPLGGTKIPGIPYPRCARKIVLSYCARNIGYAGMSAYVSLPNDSLSFVCHIVERLLSAGQIVCFAFEWLIIFDHLNRVQIETG